MKRYGVRGLGIVFILVGLLLSGAIFTSCIVGDGDTDVKLPTNPGEGWGDQDPYPHQGALSISPAIVTLECKVGSCGGHQFHFVLTGGKAPFAWTHSWPELGYLTPYDVYGDGVCRNAIYVLAYNDSIAGDDTITVIDGTGKIVTAKITKKVTQ